MQRQIALFCFAALWLVACGSESGSNEQSCSVNGGAMDGCWQSESCEIVSGESQRSQPRWSRGHYHFGHDGELLAEYRLYDNADCSGQSLASIEPWADKQAPQFAAIAMGYAPSGVLAYRLRWQLQLPNEEKPFEMESFAHIEGDRLCLSRSTRLDGRIGRWYAAADQEIDFEGGSCLRLQRS